MFEGSIAKGRADPGETVRVEAHDGRFLAWAAYSPNSMIRVRAWSFDEAERIDAAFFERRIAAAVALRARLPIDSDGVRLVHGEADGLPGLIVDRYGDTLVAQFLSAGTERWKATIADALLAGHRRCRASTSAATPGARSSKAWRRARGWLRGERAPPRSRSASTAGGSRSTSPAATRPASTSTSATTASSSPRRCASFGFAARAELLLLHRRLQRRGAGRRRGAGDERRFVGAGAGARAQRNVALNGFDAARHEALDADVNQTLRAMLEAGRSFDAIVLDPPKFAPTAAHAERAARAYKDINRLALKLLAPGGAAVHVLVLGRHRRRAVPQDRRRRRARCRRRRRSSSRASAPRPTTR